MLQSVLDLVTVKTVVLQHCSTGCCRVFSQCWLPVFMLACSWKVSRAQFDQICAATKNFGEDSLQFMSKVLHRSGLGDETYAPPSKCMLCGCQANSTYGSMLQ